MSLDISKTETFIPFFLITTKSIFIIVLFGLLSDNCISWQEISIHNIDIKHIQFKNTTTHHHPITLASSPSSYDCIIFVCILHIVIYEHKLDYFIMSKSDVTHKMANKHSNASNMRCVSDIFLACALLVYYKTFEFHCSSQYIFITSSMLWVCFGLVLFIYDILMTPALEHSQHFFKHRNSHNKKIVIHTIVIFLLSCTVISPCLSLFFSSMSYVEFCLRVFVYIFFVCLRCYTEEWILDVSTVANDISNFVLFGWILIVPNIVIYAALFVVISCYSRKYITANTKQVVSIEDVPKNIILEQKTQYKMTEATPDFLAKLKNFEREYKVDNLPHITNTNTKRRQGTLF